jgi:hypothetical protein
MRGSIILSRIATEDAQLHAQFPAVPTRDADAQGIGKVRNDCARQFRAAWEKFSADATRLNSYVRMRERFRRNCNHAGDGKLKIAFDCR